MTELTTRTKLCAAINKLAKENGLISTLTPDSFIIACVKPLYPTLISKSGPEPTKGLITMDSTDDDNIGSQILAFSLDEKQDNKSISGLLYWRFLMNKLKDRVLIPNELYRIYDPKSSRPEAYDHRSNAQSVIPLETPFNKDLWNIVLGYCGPCMKSLIELLEEVHRIDAVSYLHGIYKTENNTASIDESLNYIMPVIIAKDIILNHPQFKTDGEIYDEVIRRLPGCARAMIYSSGSTVDKAQEILKS